MCLLSDGVVQLNLARTLYMRCKPVGHQAEVAVSQNSMDVQWKPEVSFRNHLVFGCFFCYECDSEQRKRIVGIF